MLSSGRRIHRKWKGQAYNRESPVPGLYVNDYILKQNVRVRVKSLNRIVSRIRRTIFTVRSYFAPFRFANERIWRNVCLTIFVRPWPNEIAKCGWPLYETRETTPGRGKRAVNCTGRVHGGQVWWTLDTGNQEDDRGIAGYAYRENSFRRFDGTERYVKRMGIKSCKSISVSTVGRKIRPRTYILIRIWIMYGGLERSQTLFRWRDNRRIRVAFRRAIYRITFRDYLIEFSESSRPIRCQRIRSVARQSGTKQIV